LVLAYWVRKETRSPEKQSEKHWQFEQVRRRRASIANPTPTRPGIIPCGKQTKNM